MKDVGVLLSLVWDGVGFLGFVLRYCFYFVLKHDSISLLSDIQNEWLWDNFYMLFSIHSMPGFSGGFGQLFDWLWGEFQHYTEREEVCWGFIRQQCHISPRWDSCCDSERELDCPICWSLSHCSHLHHHGQLQLQCQQPRASLGSSSFLPFYI